jgi:SAM-dependent methyltransferase
MTFAMLHPDRRLTPDPFALLSEAVAWRYRPAGRFAQGFVRGKLRHDPVYRYLFEAGLPRGDGAMLDLGCGRGIALAVLAAAAALGMSAEAPTTAPRRVGIERREAHAASARVALGDEAEILTGDVLAAPFPCARLILLVDVLLYLTAAQQDRLLERAAAALVTGGRLIIREADAAAGWRYRATVAAERSSAWRRGEWCQRYHYRSRDDWLRCLGELGLNVTVRPMSAGTPFANILYLADRSAD